MNADQFIQEPVYLPADEAAAVLGIARRTLNRYARLGRIAVVHHGGHAYVSRDAIKDYFSRQDREANQRRAAAEKRARRQRGSAA